MIWRIYPERQDDLFFYCDYLPFLFLRGAIWKNKYLSFMFDLDVGVKCGIALVFLAAWAFEGPLFIIIEYKICDEGGVLHFYLYWIIHHRTNRIT
jgi:hypothetical protein